MSEGVEIEIDGNKMHFESEEQMYDYLKENKPKMYKAFLSMKSGKIFSEEYEDLKVGEIMPNTDVQRRESKTTINNIQYKTDESVENIQTQENSQDDSSPPSKQITIKQDKNMINIKFEDEMAPAEFKKIIKPFLEYLRDNGKINLNEVVDRYKLEDEHLFTFIKYVKLIEGIEVKKEFIIFGQEIFSKDKNYIIIDT